MRSPTALLLAAIVVFVVVALRIVMGGPPGPKTATAAVVGVGLLVAWFVARRRTRVTGPTVTP